MNGEETIGAFTIANLNDTDGDGRVDSLASDNVVKAFQSTITSGGGTGSTVLALESIEGFSVGDEVAIFADSNKPHDVRKVTAVDSANKTVTIDSGLSRDFGLDANDPKIGHRGRSEVDLMRLVIQRPNPEKDVVLRIKNGADKVKIWRQQIKSEQVALTDGQTTIPIADIPQAGLVLWVEVTAASSAVRDIEIELQCEGADPDVVKATGIWFKEVDIDGDGRDVLHDKADKPWGDLPNPPKRVVDETNAGHLGLIPLPGDGPNAGYLMNGILIRFEAIPADLKNEAGIEFDVARQRQSKTWKMGENGVWEVEENSLFPVQKEFANDNPPADIDKGTDSSHTLDQSNYIYSFDAPRLPRGPGIVKRAMQFNGIEFVRVQFESQRVKAIAGQDVQGSVASPAFNWHSAIYAQLLAGEAWVRNTGDDTESAQNNVGPGHMEFTDTPDAT